MIRSLILIFFAASALQSFSQDSLLLKGIIVSADSFPIANASIVVKNTDNAKAFCISKKDGSFSITINIEKKENYVIEVSHIGYKSKMQKLYFDKRENNIHDFCFILIPKTDELKEIIIKKNVPLVVVKNDTIEFNAKTYQTAEVRKVQDLLKNITGFTVDDKGHITYNGKEVEKILIEGDDLADKNYVLISKYLNASVVNKVQVLKNYNDNRLLKEVDKSGKVAVNLTINDKLKNKVSGSIEAGGSFQQRYEGDENLIYISRKIKALLLSNYNNIGNSADADVQYYFNQGETTTNNTNDEIKSGIVKSGDILFPDVGNKYIQSNNDFSTNFMNSWKIGKTIKARALIGYNIRNLKSSDFGYSEITLPSLSKWSTATIDSSNRKAKFFIAQTVINHDNLKNNTGLYSFSISGRNDLNAYKSIVSLAIVDTLSELLLNKGLDYHFNGNETFKLKKGKVLNIEAGFVRENILQDFNTSTTRLINYFLVDSFFSLNKQNTNQIYNNGWLTLKCLGKIGKINYSIGLHTAFSQMFSSNNILNVNRNYIDSIIAQPKSKLDYKDSKYSAFLNLDTKFLKKNVLVFGISLGYGEERMSDFKTCRIEKSPLMKSYLEHRYIISGFKTITTSIQVGCLQPMLQNFYGQGYLSGNATIMDGASLINIKKTKELSVAYVSNNLYSNSQFLINCIVRNSSGEYNAGYYLTPSFSKINMIPTNNNNQIIFNTSIEKYYSTIKSKIVLQFNGMLLKRNLFINNILNKNVSTSIRTQIKYITAFKSPLNLETSCTAISSQNTLSSNLQQVDKHSLWQYEGYAKLKIKASKNLYSNIVYGIYVFSSNNIYKTMDSYIVYKCEKHWTFSLSMHNLLNNKMLIQKSISANSLNEYSFRVVPRYVLGQIEFIF